MMLLRVVVSFLLLAGLACGAAPGPEASASPSWTSAVLPVVLDVTLYVVGALLMLTGLVGLVLPALPGGPLIFLGIVAIAWAGGFERIGPWGLLGMGILTAFISLVDYVSEFVGARKFGASWWGLLGAFAGLVVGLAFGLPGIVLGPIAGAVLLEYLKDPDFRRAGKVGLGTLVGFVIGTAVKYALAFVLLGWALLLYLF